MPGNNILIYLFRHDLRVSDNPILHHLSSSSEHGFTHILPLVVLAPQHLEVSGFLKDGKTSPYPPAKNELSGLWKCGPHRAKFIGESIMNLRHNMDKAGSPLIIKVGKPSQIVEEIQQRLEQEKKHVGAVWTIDEEGTEEKDEEKSLADVCAKNNISFKLWTDEKYFIDDRDLNFKDPQDLPDVFTTYRKMMEPLREKPRAPLPHLEQSSLPQNIDQTLLKNVGDSFQIPDSEDDFLGRLLAPVKDFMPNLPPYPEGAETAHPFSGGETAGLERLDALIKKGHANTYKTTRNGLLGEEFSTKLSAYLAQGCITARQVHAALVEFEEGNNKDFATVDGYGKGENEGTKGIRFELLWRDYMRLCNRKFKQRLFYRSGFRNAYDNKWKSPHATDANGEQKESPEAVNNTLKRLFDGTTGMGFIDASQRELIHTGYTSNRARQNVASFLAKHLSIDWRFGAEYYEMLLVDYDVSSNWANWQYVAGVGNDPRGEARIFNPVKQAFDYDKDGSYVRTWVPEVQKLEQLENVFQAWTTPKEDWDRFGLTGLQMAEDPVLKINFSVEGKPKNNRRPFNRRRGQGRGGGNGGSGGGGNGGGSNANGHASGGASVNGHSPKPQSQPGKQSPQQSSRHNEKPPYSAPPYSYHGPDQQPYYQTQFVGQGMLPPNYGPQRSYVPYYGNGDERGGYYAGMRGGGRTYRGRGSGYGAHPYRENYYGPPAQMPPWQSPYGYNDTQMPMPPW
ncbi:DNA photolyase, FAD-binding/Cryptochrome [Microdochium trichocladiopsis]|uniref:Cryptochrome DASH n=1 Tax=Microdochium trichocladiopsis TaxID=1682393 RepID=A0A9P9BTZ1_9PEZI|nr:DNA photolyase, FAD-binding/Cryptochrome [Microdochium trichocladiopsis]KAH7037527.1 DNA photolyase, FAD-binding/Cryptochrome [Microdochium trichocladiopsis]